MSKVHDDVARERCRQEQMYGEQNHHPLLWMNILMEEVGEAAQAASENCFDKTYDRSLDDFREEMVQVAAVAIAIIECHDRNMKKEDEA